MFLIIRKEVKEPKLGGMWDYSVDGVFNDKNTALDAVVESYDMDNQTGLDGHYSYHVVEVTK